MVTRQMDLAVSRRALVVGKSLQHEPFREEDLVTPPRNSSMTAASSSSIVSLAAPPVALYSSPLDSRIPKPVRDQAHHSRLEFLHQQLSEVEELAGDVTVQSDSLRSRRLPPTVEIVSSSSVSPLRGNGLILEDPFEVRSSSRKLIIPIDVGDDDDDDDDDAAKCSGIVGDHFDLKSSGYPVPAVAHNALLSTSVCVSDMSDDDKAPPAPPPPLQSLSVATSAEDFRKKSAQPIYHEQQHHPRDLAPNIAMESSSAVFGTKERSIFFGNEDEDFLKQAAEVASLSLSSSDDMTNDDELVFMEKSVQRHCEKEAIRRHPSLKGAASFSDVVARMLAVEQIKRQQLQRGRANSEAVGGSVVITNHEIALDDDEAAASVPRSPQVITVRAVLCRGEPGFDLEQSTTFGSSIAKDQTDAMCANMTVVPHEQLVTARGFRVFKRWKRLLLLVVIAAVFAAVVIGALAGTKKIH